MLLDFFGHNGKVIDHLKEMVKLQPVLEKDVGGRPFLVGFLCRALSSDNSLKAICLNLEMHIDPTNS